MKRKRILYLAILAIVAVATAMWLARWNRLDTALSASGGLPMWCVIANVPHFLQNDERWANDKIGATDETLAEVGCAVTSAAMVLANYGIETDPAILNRFLTKHPQGYTAQGWLYWETAAEFDASRTAGLLPHYEDAPSFRLIDTNLMRGNPVIVRVRMPSGTTHFVVVVGKRAFDYLALDPLVSEGVIPLKALDSPIEALRFYSTFSLAQPRSQVLHYQVHQK